MVCLYGKTSHSKVENQIVAMDVLLNTVWIVKAINLLLIQFHQKELLDFHFFKRKQGIAAKPLVMLFLLWLTFFKVILKVLYYSKITEIYFKNPKQFRME